MCFYLLLLFWFFLCFFFVFCFFFSVSFVVVIVVFIYILDNLSLKVSVCEKQMILIHILSHLHHTCILSV